MAKISLLVAALVFALTCMGSADGYQCYQCTYLEAGGTGSESSCKTGETPDSGLKEECLEVQNLDNYAPAFRPFFEAQNNYSRTAVAESKQIIYGCGKAVIASLGTVRGCVIYINSGNVEDKCDEGTVTEIANGNTFWRHYALPYLVGYGSNLFTGCTCTGENCNSGFFVKSSLSLLVASLALTFLKNY